MGAGAVAGDDGTEAGENGRSARAGLPFGPEVIEKNWVEVWFGSSVAQGTNSVLTA